MVRYSSGARVSTTPLRHLEPRYVWLHWSCTMLPFKMYIYMSCVISNIFQRNRIFHPIGPFRFYVTFSVLRCLFLLSFGLLFKLLCSLLFLYPMKRTARRTSIRRSPGYLATHKLHVRFFFSEVISQTNAGGKHGKHHLLSPWCIFQSPTKLRIISSSTGFFQQTLFQQAVGNGWNDVYHDTTWHKQNQQLDKAPKKQMSSYLPTSLP